MMRRVYEVQTRGILLGVTTQNVGDSGAVDSAGYAIRGIART